MRREEKEVTEFEKKIAIIDACKVMRLGIYDGQIPYVVPVNFGYSVKGEELTLYFHSAKEGRKIDALNTFPLVCFEMDCEHELIEGKLACNYSYAFASIIGTGTVWFLESPAEKVEALQFIMEHQTGKKISFHFEEVMLTRTAVCKLVVNEYTAKRHEVS
ncbi:MAG: pyridoxamine 5'-phosphate oxidase family protein [Spirochaetaceae bacterium]|jgi:nitroimidazol reductase NimA-like FMN-containing flavoprotein (pyridoxamine 5'-phosphate oxidase superfamily)|nr:pyridoxamine 5'-phosphate oxidase family protein [Spirochaetaceae bacterium]